MLREFNNIIPDTIDFKSFYDRTESAANVHPAGAYVDELITRLRGGSTVLGDPMPWGKFRDHFKFRAKEVTGYVGYKGHTKSAVISEIFGNFMAMGRKCLVISPEFPVGELLLRSARQCAATMHPSESYGRAWSNWANDRLWVFDKQSRLSPELVLGVVAYAIQDLGINHILVDSLMKCGIKGNGGALYEAQADFMDRLQHLAHAADDTHLHMVMHARKDEDDSRPPGLHDCKGASELVDMLENVLVVHMDKKKTIARESGTGVDNTNPDITITIEAQRNHPKFGRYGLWFAPGLRFAERHEATVRPYFDAPTREPGCDDDVDFFTQDAA